MMAANAHTEVPANTATPRARLVAATMASDHRRQVAEIPTALLDGGEGPPVVFLQGEFGPVWWRVIPDLLATHRVIAPDLPGLGASEFTWPPRPGHRPGLAGGPGRADLHATARPDRQGPGRSDRSPVRRPPRRPPRRSRARGQPGACAVPSTPRAGPDLSPGPAPPQRTEPGTRFPPLLLRGPRRRSHGHGRHLPGDGRLCRRMLPRTSCAHGHAPAGPSVRLPDPADRPRTHQHPDGPHLGTPRHRDTCGGGPGRQ